VNEEFIVAKANICKHCDCEAHKGCCSNYNNKDRLTKRIVKNIEIIQK